MVDVIGKSETDGYLRTVSSVRHLVVKGGFLCFLKHEKVGVMI